MPVEPQIFIMNQNVSSPASLPRSGRRCAPAAMAHLCGVVILAMMAAYLPAQSGSGSSIFTLLHPEDYRHYAQQFAADEREATGKEPGDEWAWMAANIPLFASSNKQFEEMYYFRWYAWQKHLVETPHGYIITEWLPKPAEADGLYGALPDAAPFHLGEARWLRDPQIPADYARMWATPDAGARKYSFAWADSVHNVTLATGDAKLGVDLLPALVENYKAWDDHLDRSVGLYWQIDTRDAMEKSIGGDGYRTPLNSYMVADGEAIAAFARDAGQQSVAQEYAAKSAALEEKIETRLWNPMDEFYEDLSPAADSGIRKEKRFKDPGTVLKFSGVRELIGYIPWEFYAPASSHDVAWKQLFDPEGFAGKYGPTTAERRSPRFRFASDDQCTWNGPSWPYATTQTLLALANLLNGAPQSDIASPQYYRLFSNYVLSQHIKLPSGRTIDWIDEDLDADTDEWIAKDILIQKQRQVGRGNYYNHSGFADPLITGLIGLRPRADNKLIVHPLLPPGEWTYFAIDGLPYHGHVLAIVYDQTGKEFNRGRGLTIFVDGKSIANRATLGPLEAALPAEK
jgi:Trehalase